MQTRAELRADGTPRPADVPSVCLVFDGMDAAVAFSEETVGKHEHVRCEVYGREGKAVPPAAIVLHPNHAGQLPNRRTATRVLLAAAACAAASAPLFWADYQSGGRLVVPTYVGFTLLVVTVRLLFWGFSDLAKARQRERDAAGGAPPGHGR